MLIDAHLHAFSEEALKQRQGICQSGKEPAFGWLYADPRARMLTPEALLSRMDQEGIQQAVVCAFPFSDPGRARTDNDCLLAAARAHPDRLVPLAAVDPRSPGATREAGRALAAGVAGLGELGIYRHDLTEPDSARGLDALCHLAAEADRPLLLHTNEPVGHAYPGKSPMELGPLYRLIQRHPKTRFQLAHLGGGLFFYLHLKKEVEQVLARCVFDTAAAPFLYQPGWVRGFLAAAGSERLLFGSDLPLLGVERYRKDFAAGGLPVEWEPRIFCENARTFWRLEKPSPNPTGIRPLSP